MRERTKLPGLSGEGRSSATTLLVSTALEWMNGKGSGVPAEKRKLLGIHRQPPGRRAPSGSLQRFPVRQPSAWRDPASGPGRRRRWNGRGRIRSTGRERRSGSRRRTRKRRIHWMLDPDAGAVVREDAQRSLAKVLAHRVWTDLRRGWRYTNPSLSVLKLIDVAFIGLDDIAEDAGQFTAILPSFGDAGRCRAQGDAEAAPWRHARRPCREHGGARSDRPRRRRAEVQKSPARSLGYRRKGDAEKSNDPDSASSGQGRRSDCGKNRPSSAQVTIPGLVASSIGRASSATKLGKADYLTVMTGLMEILAREGLVHARSTSRTICAAGVCHLQRFGSFLGKPFAKGQRRATVYFHDLYNAIAADLKSGRSPYWGLEGREHTAQVSQRQREWREWRFRFRKGRSEESCRECRRSQGGRRSPSNSCPPCFVRRRWSSASTSPR